MLCIAWHCEGIPHGQKAIWILQKRSKIRPHNAKKEPSNVVDGNVGGSPGCRNRAVVSTLSWLITELTSLMAVTSQLRYERVSRGFGIHYVCGCTCWSIKIRMLNLSSVRRFRVVLTLPMLNRQGLDALSPVQQPWWTKWSMSNGETKEPRRTQKLVCWSKLVWSAYRRSV